MSSKDEQSFMYYPEITNPNFNEGIYIKNEFRSNEMKHGIEMNQNIIKNNLKSKEFELEPHQNFLKNYIHPDTPYNGIMVYHGTGVGKTCSAISIAEGFKKTLKNMNKKVLIICNPGIDKNFKKEIYDFSKEDVSKYSQNINLQCTGREYDLGAESMYLTKKERKKEIGKMINSYYEFIGYIKFANLIKKKTNNWDGEENTITDNIKKFISKEFDDRVIIIDEIQNIKTAKKEKLEKTIQAMLMSIIKYGKNIKIILMSATPMFDRADEIIFYLNLLLENDKRKIIQKNEIFNSDGTPKTGYEDKLKKLLTGYVSYIRAEKPFIFPFKIYPKKAKVPTIMYDFKGKSIENNKKIKFTKIMNVDMHDVQNNTYVQYFTEKNKELNNEINYHDDLEEDKRIIHFDLTEISNIVFPKLEKKKLSTLGSFGKENMNYSKDNGKSGFVRNTKYIGLKKKIKYSYQKHAIFNRGTLEEAPFNDEKHLKNYSTKFDSVLKSIRHSKGLVFIFSNFIDQGVLPLALTLEQNGFSRYTVQGEESLLDYSPNKKGGGGKRKPICYLCGNHIQDKIHQDVHNKNYHVFLRAKYIMFFGEQRDIIRIRKEQAVNTFSNTNNKYGEEVKVFIGTTAVSEGLDFKNIRQVHILDPWYNLSKHSQIIGRAIRKNSHIELPKEEQNVEIFEYAAVINSPSNKLNQTESIDLRNYRIAENKDLIIKKIIRIMKESSVDCVFFKKANVIYSNKKVDQITPNGEKIKVMIGDQPYSSQCDYYENCDYQCNWTPDPKKKYPVNNDTFTIESGKTDIQKCKRIILHMFEEDYAFYLQNFIDKIREKYPQMNDLFIYSAIEDMVDNKNFTVLDKFNIKGYIIYAGDYYVFQPYDVLNRKIPLEYRTVPLSSKPKSVELKDIDYDYPVKESNIEIENPIKIYDKYLQQVTKYKDLLENYFTDNKNKNNKNNINLELAIIGTIVDKFNKQDDVKFMKVILQKIFDKNDISTMLLTYCKPKLLNYYQNINYHKNKNEKWIGFKSYGDYYVFTSINEKKPVANIQSKYIEKASPELNDIIKRQQSIYKKNNKPKNRKINKTNIYGEITLIKDTEKKFRIIDKSEEKEVITKEKKQSKRAKVTGRVCGTINKETIKNIIKKIELKLERLSIKPKIDILCTIIEIYLRWKQYTYKEEIWFLFEE